MRKGPPDREALAAIARHLRNDAEELSLAYRLRSLRKEPLGKVEPLLQL